MQWLLDSMTDTAAYVRNARIDILAANTLGRALYAPVFEMPGKPNIARFVFLDPRSQDFFVEWPKVAGESAAMLRTLAGENPYDQGLTSLVGELSTRSETFRTLWAAHDVRQHRTGVKRFQHPLVGEMTLSYESMEITADQGLRLNAYVAEPGSPSATAAPGAVQVMIDYVVPPENMADWLAAMEEMRRSRARSGATRWELYRMGERPDTYGEIFTVSSWSEHLHQHEVRLTAEDQAIEERAHSYVTGPVDALYLLPAVGPAAASEGEG